MNITKGIIQTVAGTGEPGYSGDGGLAEWALINDPFMCDFDQQGNMYFGQAKGHTVRRVTVVGTGAEGYSGDRGPALQATVNQIYSLCVDTNGDIYIVDRLNAAVRKIAAATGIITTVAGTGEPGYSGDGGPGNEAQLREPNDAFLDGKGGLLIADIQDQRIRRLDLATGIITTFAGNGEKVRAGDGSPAAQDGVRKIDANGIMSTFAGTGEKGYSGDGGPALASTWNGPKAIRCDHQDNILVVDTENHAIRRIDGVTGVVTTVAGGRLGADGDGGNPTAAGLDRPHGVGVDRAGNLFIADSNNNRVRVVGLA